MFLETLLPSLPTTAMEVYMYVGGMLGTILLVYSIFIETEYRSDIMRAVGALLLLSYTLLIPNYFLSFTFGVVALGSLIEAVEIHFGWLKKTEERR